MLWGDLSPLVRFTASKWDVHINEASGACWRLLPPDGLDLHRVRDYLQHRFSIIDRRYDRTPPRGERVPRSAVLEGGGDAGL
jgi:hypothetical protein